MAEDSTFSLKRLLVGKPIPSHLAHHERLSRLTGLAVLASDALSSVAYATDLILATLIVAGADVFLRRDDLGIDRRRARSVSDWAHGSDPGAAPTGHRPPPADNISSPHRLRGRLHRDDRRRGGLRRRARVPAAGVEERRGDA